MSVHIVPRFARRSVVALITVAAAGCLAGPAMAATSTMTVASSTATPEQAVPVDLSFSGTNGLTSNAEVEAVVRPAGGLSCLSSYQEDTSTFPSQDITIFAPGSQSVAPGAYQVAGSFKPAAPGAYQVCAWLAQNQSSTDQPVTAPATLTVTARGPQVSQLTVTVPKNPAPNVAFQIGYTTQTDQQLTLFSVLKAATAAPCASSFELDQAQNQPEATLFGIGSSLVFGGPTTSTVTTKQKTGFYLICTWIEGPNTQQVDRSDSTPLTVGTPVPPTPPKPGLVLTRLRASHRHGVSATGTTAAGFSGRLLLTASCGASTAKRSTTAKRRRFSATVGLPSGCRTARKVKITVAWAGSSAFSKQSVNKTVAIAK
jgi:hypothetical protein